MALSSLQYSEEGDRDAHFRLLAWCIDQLGGSIALDPADFHRVFREDPYHSIESYKTDTGALVVRVIKRDQ